MMMAPGQQEGELQADDGQHRDERIAQRVPPQRLSLAQPLGPCRAHIVLAQRFQQRRAHDPRQDRGLRQRQRDSRQVSAFRAGQRPADQPGKPPAENQRRVMENSRTSSMANQKFGTLMPTCVAPMMPKSTALLRRAAAITPTGMAISVESASAIGQAAATLLPVRRRVRTLPWCRCSCAPDRPGAYR